MGLVMLAEDNVDHQRLVAGVLRRLGHDVVVAGDGRAGLAAIAERRPDLVVTDLDMPHLDGIQLCRALRADPALADIPIMLLTGYLRPSDPQLAAVGATAVITKPFTIPELTATLRRHLGDPSPPAEAPAGAPAVVGDVRTSAAFVSALLDGLDAGVVTCDADGRMTILNPALQALFSGFGGTPVPQERWTRGGYLRHPDGTPLEPGEFPLVRALAGEHVRQAEVLTDDSAGEEYWLSVNAEPIRDAAGARTGAVAVVHDISARHRAQRFQDCTTEVLDVLAQSPDTATLGDRILRAVGATLGWPYLRLWLVDATGAALRPTATFVADGAEPLPFPESMARGQGMAGICWQRADLVWVPDVHAADSPVLPEVVASTSYRAAGAVPVRSADRVTGVLTFFSRSPQEPEPALAVLLRGIAGTIGAYLERQRAEELSTHLAASTDEYVALVGHELRTPLTAISAYTDLIMESPDTATIGEVRDLLTVIERNNRRLRTLIDSLLDLAALESGHAGLAALPVDLAEVTAAAVAEISPTAAEHRITIEVDRPAELLVPGDQRRLRQVVDSLLSNAVKFSPDGATVAVCVAADGETAALTVTDTGSGIDADEQPNLFRGLFRGRNAHHSGIPGSGLGLTLSKVVVERHHGTITLAPNQPTGTTVTVRVPRLPTP
jgi:signal transduction histidine kinase/CheY-like chemotaxis protein